MSWRSHYFDEKTPELLHIIYTFMLKMDTSKFWEIYVGTKIFIEIMSRFHMSYGQSYF